MPISKLKPPKDMSAPNWPNFPRWQDIKLIPANKKKYARPVRVKRKAATSVKNGWVPKNEFVSIAERQIPGMVYVFDSGTVKKNSNCLESKVYIDTSLSVREPAAKDSQPNSMYYGEMQPEFRACFLDWLATGMCDLDYHPIYPTLYIYGLERRLLFDQTPDLENQDITDELVRLRQLFEKVPVMLNMVRSVLTFAELWRNPYESTLICQPNNFLNLPPKLLIDISDSIYNGKNLTAELLMEWFLFVPTPHFDARKLTDSQFKKNFVQTFNSLYSRGLAVKSPEAFLNLEYEALTCEFKVVEQFTHNGRPVLDIRRLNTPLGIAYEIATKDRSYFQSVFGRNLSRLALLNSIPKKQWNESFIENYNLLRMLTARAQLYKERIPAKDVVASLIPYHAGRIGTDQWNRVDEMLLTIGFGVTPNELLYLKPPKRAAPVAFYDLCNRSKMRPNYTMQYNTAMVKLGVCSFLLHSLNLTIKKSAKKLHQFIDSIPKLKEPEIAGLRANVEYLLEVPPDRSYLKRLKDWDAWESTDSFRPVIIDFVKGKNQFKPKTVSLVEKIYQALQLDTKLAYSDLHAGDIIADSNRKSEKRPAKAKLDAKVIASVKNDTEKVSQLLGDIFATDGPDQQNVENIDGRNREHGQKIRSKGLDSKHAEFLQKILEQDFWDEDDFAKLAKENGLLAVGAAESINEWFFEHYNDTLLEEYDGIHIDPALSATLKAELNKD